MPELELYLTDDNTWLVMEWAVDMESGQDWGEYNTREEAKAAAEKLAVKHGWAINDAA